MVKPFCNGCGEALTQKDINYCVKCGNNYCVKCWLAEECRTGGSHI